MVRKKQMTISDQGSVVKNKKVALQKTANKKKPVKKINAYTKELEKEEFLAKSIIIEKVTSRDLKNYVDQQKAESKSDLTLNEFITLSRERKKDSILISDLSNLTIGKARSNKLFDLRGANFIGSIFYNTKFIHCDLEGAKFSGAHLEQVVFKDSNLNFVDFRRADLSSCEFSEKYSYPPWNSLEGLKFSSTVSCIRVFADIKNDLAKKNEQQRLLHNKKIEFREVRKKTPLLSRMALFFHLTDNCREYRRVRSEYNKMLKGIFHNDHMIHTSLQNVFHPESFVFDPVLLKDEDFCSDKKIKKNLVSLNRRDVIEFLKKSKGSKKISINDFAQGVYTKSLPKGSAIDKNMKFIADISSKVNIFGNNEWNRINLSGLDFSGVDISEANFAGSNLNKCIFKNTNISYSNFESAVMDSAVFDKVDAVGSNFYNSDCSNSNISDSDFRESRFDWSNLKDSVFNNINLAFAKARNASWRQVCLTKCNMNNTDFSNVDFRRSKFVEVSAKHSLFNKSNFNNSSFSNCCVIGSLFNLVHALHTIWDQTNAKGIEARYSNYTGCKFSEKCQFENSDFSHSILDGIKAPRAHFSGAKMNYVKIGYGKFAESCFTGASLRFAELSSCVFSESSCKDIDFTGAKIFNIRMMKSMLSGSVWNGTELRDSNFSDSDFSDANWKNIIIKDTILEGINNRRIKINDNTEIIDCQFKDLTGQFYHYDEDNFMDIMFIEQLTLNMQNIQYAERLKRWGVLSFILKIIDSEYRIPNKEVRRLNNYKLRNKNELKKILRKLKTEDQHGVNLYKFICINSISRP